MSSGAWAGDGCRGVSIGAGEGTAGSHPTRWSRPARGLPDVGGVDSAQALLLAAAAVAVLLVVIPLLFFGVELIVFGVLVAGGLMARVVSGSRGSSRRRSSDPLTSDRRWSGASAGGGSPASSSTRSPRTWPRGASRPTRTAGVTRAGVPPWSPRWHRDTMDFA